MIRSTVPKCFVIQVATVLIFLSDFFRQPFRGLSSLFYLLMICIWQSLLSHHKQPNKCRTTCKWHLFSVVNCKNAKRQNMYMYLACQKLFMAKILLDSEPCTCLQMSTNPFSPLFNKKADKYLCTQVKMSPLKLTVRTNPMNFNVELLRLEL